MPGSSRSAEVTLIFDGDDTLWRTMPLYAQAKRRFFDCMESLGLLQRFASLQKPLAAISFMAASWIYLRKFSLK